MTIPPYAQQRIRDRSNLPDDVRAAADRDPVTEIAALTEFLDHYDHHQVMGVEWPDYLRSRLISAGTIEPAFKHETV
jgi:hypothetical protein